MLNESEGSSLILDQDFLDENIKLSRKSPKMDLDLYKDNFEQKINHLENKDEPIDYQIENEIETSDLQHLEPKLKEAWIKMRKLDKILEKVCLKEKKVKIETQQLISRNRKELELIRLNSEHKESKSEAENTAHFLSLSYINVDDDMIKELDFNNEPSTPVFKTQLPDTDRDRINDSSLNSHTRIKENDKLSKTNSIKSSNNLSSNTNKTTHSQKKNSYDPSDLHEKNFIRRNIEVIYCYELILDKIILISLYYFSSARNFLINFYIEINLEYLLDNCYQNNENYLVFAKRSYLLKYLQKFDCFKNLFN
jgi:hypothetical protein